MNRKMQKVLLVAGIFLLVIRVGYSQQQLGGTTADKQMQGNASSGSAIGGLYSPSLYDGTANINIPIYQYSADGGDYGISLGYNTRGVKLDALAGPVGLNFSLRANGSIQRVTKDIPDDIYCENDNEIIVGNFTLLNPEKKYRGRLVVYGESLVQAAEDSVYRDHESDDYVVSAGTLSFTFNLGKNGYVFTNPQRNVKVELLYGGVPVTSLPSVSPLGAPTFRITDEQGNRYFFEVGDYTFENIEDKYGHKQVVGGYTYAKSWIIKKIITSSGAELNYYYSYVQHNAPYKTYSATEPGPPYGPGGSPYYDQTHYAQLDSIAYPNKITAYFKFDEFPTLDDATGALREIQLKSGGTIQLRYLMDQAYFVASNLGTAETNYGLAEVPYATGSAGEKINYRLKLKGIRIAGQGGTPEPYYTFSYDPLLLPKRFNGSQDYYGYYNGKVPNYYDPSTPDYDLSIPDHQPYLPGYSAPWYGVNKSPDINYLKACILTHIRNAYGGQVQFLYDEHVLEGVLNTTNTPGYPDAEQYFMGKYAYDGLRLQAIIERDTFHVENFRKTIFAYTGGQLFINGGYYHYPLTYTDIGHTLKQISMGNQYVSRHQLVAGANHGYSSVTVKHVDQNNNQFSRTVYNFTNFKDENNVPRYQRVGAGSNYFFTFPYADKQLLRDWEMGLPTSIREYDQNDFITLETTNNYSFSIDSTSSANKIENTRLAEVKTDFVPVLVQTLPNTIVFTDSYRPFRGKAQLVSSQVKKYVSDAAFVNDAVTYAYDGHNNIKYTLTSNSRGEYYKTENVYNYELDVLSGSGLQAFTDAGLEKVVSTQRWKTDVTGGQHLQFMDGFISTFDYNSQQVHAKRMYTLMPGLPVTRNQYTGYSGSGPIPNPHHKVIEAFQGTVPQYFRLSSEVLLSDVKGNPLESRLGDQDQFKAMIWDDVDGKKLAEAGNCHYADIAYCGFETPATGTITRGNVTYNAAQVDPEPSLGTIHKAAYALQSVPGTTAIEGSHVLTAGKQYLLSFWAMGGEPLVFSGSSSLPVPAALQQYYNYKYYTIPFTAGAGDKFKIQSSTPGIIYIDEVRLQPADAQMQSWNHTPMFGPATISDGNGRLTFIKYDGQGRQKIVRDKDGNIISKTEYVIQ